ncbi:MAG: PilW family protein [Armatimonadota bacterium]
MMNINKRTYKKSNRARRGFTLAELLVVMAISTILMGLVLYPVVASFRLTRQAQAMVDSQDAARMALASISRELGQAMFVYDNAQIPFAPAPPGLPAGVVANKTETPIMMPVAQPGSSAPHWFVLPYGMIDFILPKIFMHCNNPDHPAGSPRNYPRDLVIDDGENTRTELRAWPDCPYCQAAGLKADDVEAQPKTPLEPSVTHVRYFVALRYNNLGMPLTQGAPPNLGWVPPWGKNVVEGTENGAVLYRAEYNPYDNNLFPAAMSVNERIHDPYFFYRTGNAANGLPYHANWLRTARVVGIGKYEDLIDAEFSPDGTVRSVDPTVKFQTSSVENDTFNPAYSTDAKNDYPNAPATVFAGTYGYWTPDHRIDVMRGAYMEDPPSGYDYYTVMDGDEHLIIRRVPNGNNWDESTEFSITEYLRTGFVAPDSSRRQPLEMAFTVDMNKGNVSFALQPPRPGGAASGPVAFDSAKDINDDFHNQYDADRGGAIRWSLLPTFNPSVGDQYLANARIVPGSETVIGPDMTLGENFARPVRYERVPLSLGNPGINQYMIDNDSGRLFFSRDPSLDLPELDANSQPCVIQVYYLVYFNRKDDVVRGDYLTKSLITVHLGMKMFDPELGKPFPVDLTDKVKVRNALR